MESYQSNPAYSTLPATTPDHRKGTSVRYINNPSPPLTSLRHTRTSPCPCHSHTHTPTAFKHESNTNIPILFAVFTITVPKVGREQLLRYLLCECRWSHAYAHALGISLRILRRERGTVSKVDRRLDGSADVVEGGDAVVCCVRLGWVCEPVADRTYDLLYFGISVNASQERLQNRYSHSSKETPMPMPCQSYICHITPIVYMT